MLGISSTATVGLLLVSLHLILLQMISGALISDSRCIISSPYESRYIHAFLETSVPTLQSCFSNSTTAASQEIHVVNLRQVPNTKDTNPKEVHVTVKSHQSRGKYRMPLVVVLKSDVPTTWRVETVKIRDASPVRHLFVISNHSTILFHNFGLRRSVLNRDDIPSDSHELAQWVEERYGQLTAFAELSRVNALVVEVGIHKVPGMPALCELEGRRQKASFIRGTSRESRPITGCASYGSPSEPRPKSVHIIEVSGGVVGDTPEIVVEIVPEILGSVRSELVLLLKSPPDLSWKVKSRKVHGSIEVVGNSRVDTEAVRMDTVETRVESLPFSGKELVAWVESRYCPILSYSGVPNTNHIILSIPKQDEPKDNGPRKDVPPYLSQPKAPRLSPFKNPSRTEVAVRHAVTTECHARGVEIYLPKSVAQRYGIREDYLSLRSPSCRAHSNATHYILTSTLYGCHMQITERRGEIVYSNALVIKVERRPIVTDLIDVGSGGGSDTDDNLEYSGSGAGEDNSDETHIDDEDYHVQTLEIGVQCKQTPEIKPHPSYRQKVTYFLDAFTDREYSAVADYPVIVTRGQTVYMQASLVVEPGLGLQLHECQLETVTGSLPLLHIVKQGCLVQSESRWQSQDSGNDVLSSGSTTRFSFTVPVDFQAPRFTVSCVARPCSKPSLRSNFKLPSKCMEQSKLCSLQQSVLAPPSDASLLSNIQSTGAFQLRFPNDFPRPIKGQLPPRNRVEQEEGSPSENDKTPEGKIVMEGLDSGTVIGIAFAAFVIGVMLTAALWYIHAHTGPVKQSGTTRGWAESSGETTPCSTAPIHVST